MGAGIHLALLEVRSWHLITIRSVATSWAFAAEIISMIHAAMSFGAWLVGAEINLYLATVAGVALRAVTLVAANVIDAFTAILTRIRFAFIILEVAQLPGESWLTEAAEAILLIHTDAVHTGRRLALVQAVLAQRSCEAGRTIAAKMRRVTNTAAAIHALGGIAGIRLVLTVLARISVWTQALVGIALMTLRQVNTDAIVGTRTGVTRIDLFAVRARKTAATLTLVLLHAGVRVAHSLARTIGILATIVGFRGHLQANTLRSPQLGHHN